LGGCFEGHGVIKGGTIKYQPTSASAAAWRTFILLSLEARIVARDAAGLSPVSLGPTYGVAGFEASFR
jgi:hypothetical protein